MAYTEYIRKNAKTLDWEHYIPSDTGDNATWLPGLYGKIFTNNGNYTIPTKLEDINNFDGNVSIYNGINSGIILTPAKITWLNIKEYNKVNNVNIVELLDSAENLEMYAPIILFSSINAPEILIAYGTSYQNILRTYNPILAENPLNDKYVTYNWKLNDKPIQKRTYETNIDGITEDSLIVSASFINDSILSCEISNNVTKTETKPITIKPVQLKNEKKLGINLIQNIDGADGLKKWTVDTTGQPEVDMIWNPDTQSGRSDPLTAFGGSGDFQPEFQKNDFNIIGPYPANLNTPWEYKQFFHGGSTETDNYTVCYQDIDINSLIDITDKKILNANNLKGQLIAYLGGEGVSSYYPGKDYNVIQTQTHNLDRIRIRIQMLDEFGNLINNSNYIYNPITNRYRIALFLRMVDFYIPIGTRTLRVSQEYERYHNYTTGAIQMRYVSGQSNPYFITYDEILYPTYNEALAHIYYNASGIYDYALNPIPSLNRGYTTKNGEFIYRHNTAATFINLSLSVDNFVDFKFNKKLLSKYSTIINKPDEIARPNVNPILLSLDEIYSSLFNKINDLKLLGISNTTDQINNIKSDNWFTNKFNESEIINSVNNDIYKLNIDYNKRKNSNEWYMLNNIN